MTDARPIENARISTRPKATRWSEIAASSTTRAVGQGMIPTRHANGEEAADPVPPAGGRGVLLLGHVSWW